MTSPARPARARSASRLTGAPLMARDPGRPRPLRETAATDRPLSAARADRQRRSTRAAALLRTGCVVVVPRSVPEAPIAAELSVDCGSSLTWRRSHPKRWPADASRMRQRAQSVGDSSVVPGSTPSPFSRRGSWFESRRQNPGRLKISIDAPLIKTLSRCVWNRGRRGRSSLLKLGAPGSNGSGCARGR